MNALNASSKGSFLILAALALIVGGCGKGGSNSYEVSGKVTFNGKAVPKGMITFIPDTSKKNSGPGGGAEIVDGSFSTPKGKGISGGAYIVKIVGFDGVPYTESGEEIKEGHSLFPEYVIKVDFPEEDVERDFEVPAPKKGR